MTGWRTINLLLYPVFLCQFFRTRSLFDNASVREAGGGIKSFAPFDGVGFSVLPMVFREELGMVALTLPLQTWQIVFTVIIIGLLSEIVRKGIDMLKIFFGYRENAILNVDTYFNNTYDDEWFENSFVRKIVNVVDGSEVRDRQLIVSPVLGQIPPERLSGGAKALILLYETDGFYTDLIVCGKNCEDLLLDIGEEKDVSCSLSGFDLSLDSLGTGRHMTPVCCENDGTLLHTHQEFVMKMLTISGGNHEG